MEQLRIEPLGALDRATPPPLEDSPGLAEACRVRRAHLRPVGIAPVELSVDERPDLTPLIVEPATSPVDDAVAQVDPPHAHPAQVDAAELRSGQVDATEAVAPASTRASLSRSGIDSTTRER